MAYMFSKIFQTHLTQYGTIALRDHTLYKSIVGALQYVTITRLELDYFVNINTCISLKSIIGKHSNDPMISCWNNSTWSTPS